MRVAFSGVGADELFGGYSHMVGLDRPRLLRVRQIRASGLAPWRRRQLREMRGRLLPADHRTMTAGPPGGADPSGGKVSLRAASLLELCGYLRDTLLRDGDAVTMHHGLELRVPFLDPELAALALALDETQHREGGSKGLLRQVAAPLLPDAVLNSPKRGFNLALAPWLLDHPRFGPRRISRLLRSQLTRRDLPDPQGAVAASWLLLRATNRWGPYWRWVVLAEWLQRE